MAIVATTVRAAPVDEKRQSDKGSFGLSIGEEGLFDLRYLRTYKLSSAHGSAPIRQVKYQPDSEPLVVSGAMVAPDMARSIGCLSEHSAPTGWQYGYVMPGQTAPLQLTVPHTGGEASQGAATMGFQSGCGGPFLWNGNGKDHFDACCGPEQAISTYQKSIVVVIR